jgi:nitrite reductase/ring-hydroxylating ferredoxin subunit
MTQFTKVSTVEEVAVGKMKEVRVGARTIVLANVDGEYLAFDGVCTHAQCPLAGGFLDGYTLTCYCHGAQFDIKKGDVLSPPATNRLGVYPVKIEGSNILVGV